MAARKSSGSKARAGSKKKAARKSAKKTAAKRGRPPKLYTLTEIGKLAGISMPTLQKYKREYQDRIPSVGEGRKQRYPKSAIKALQKIKQENLAKRGRPPRAKTGGSRAGGPKAGGSGRKRAARSAATAAGLLTLKEVQRRTGISYPTLSRYVKLFLDRIPHEGSGRTRRFPEEAVDVFRQIRSESKPGRPAGKSSAKGGGETDRDLATRIRRLEKAVADLVVSLKKPIQVTIKGR